MRTKFLAWLLPLLFSASPAVAAGSTQLGLRVPPGFVVSEFADSKPANDIFSMTFDPRGRVVVSGPGYIRVLVDDDGDGKADRVLDVADGLREGAQGLLWEGRWLYFTGEGGLRRYRVNEDGSRAVGASELIRAIRTGGEHCAHAVRRGPDGRLYLLCGNTAGVDRTYSRLPGSPVTDPVAGCVLRFSEDLKECEVVADGFRNPYGMDFNPDGELFTFDSDNERCVSLPWYEPTRLYHVVAGGHYGWQAPQHGQFWRRPPYFCDVVAPVATFGRGSPTGVASYRHVQFPERYRGGLFLADWTFGRVYFASLSRSGSTYTCRKEVFLETTGDNGFAPTALAVHPETGDLFVAIGGRGTRGAVYRVRYAGGNMPFDGGAVARLQPGARSVEWKADLRRELTTAATGAEPAERLHALNAVCRHHEQFSADELQKICRANLGHADRYVRQAAARLIALLSAPDRMALGLRATKPDEQATFGLGLLRAGSPEGWRVALGLLNKNDVDPAVRLWAIRLLQLALGDITSPSVHGTVWEGYSLRQPSVPGDKRAEALAAVRRLFPAGDADLDRELSRALAMLEDDDPAVTARVLDHIAPSSDPVEDFHYLIVLGRLRGRLPARGAERVAGALLALDRKLDRLHRNRDTYWPLRLRELYDVLARKHPALNQSVAAHPEFGRPDHALFAGAPGFDRHRAAKVFLARAARDPEFAWTSAVVEVVGSLPDERCVPVLRGLWGKAGLEEALLPILARHPQPGDRERFLEGLKFAQPGLVATCLAALDRLGGPSDGAQVLAVIRSLRRLPPGKEADHLRERMARDLERWTGVKEPGKDVRAWVAWFDRTYPSLAGQLDSADGVDLGGWKKRLAKLDWSAGDAVRGRGVFIQAGCAACHSGAQALGPDLHGVAARFSRDDLLTAILQPSRDISSRYRTTVVTTTAGKTYQGLLIYEATDGLLLQTGPSTTVRLLADQVDSRHPSDVSMMPVGLLDKCSDRDIADLFAFLKELKAKP